MTPEYEIKNCLFSENHKQCFLRSGLLDWQAKEKSESEFWITGPKTGFARLCLKVNGRTEETWHKFFPL